MNLKTHVIFAAQYNQWMNENIFKAANKLSNAQLAENKGAFFGSILGTLNHLVVTDTMWLKRLSSALPLHIELQQLPVINPLLELNTTLFTELNSLRTYQKQLELIYIEFTTLCSMDELNQNIKYSNTHGQLFNRNLFSILMHIINHQTHHRGQITTLLSQFNIAVGATDMAVLLPDFD